VPPDVLPQPGPHQPALSKAANEQTQPLPSGYGWQVLMREPGPQE